MSKINIESNRILEFLKTKKEVKLNKVEGLAKLPKGTLTKCIKTNRKLPPKHIANIEAVLKELYNYKKHDCHVISIANNKGGVGKTTTAVNLSKALSVLGYNVLCIDVDAQGNCSQNLGYSEPKHELYDIITDEVDITDAIIHLEVKENRGVFDLIPSSIKLDNILNNTSSMKLLVKLKNKLPEIKEDYDFIIIDCPPSLNSVMASALIASDSIILTIQPEEHSITGSKNIINLMDDVKSLNPKIKILGVLFTIVEKNTIIHKTKMNEIKQIYSEEKVFDTIIRKNIDIKESPSLPSDIFDYTGYNGKTKKIKAGAEDYLNLAIEITKS